VREDQARCFEWERVLRIHTKKQRYAVGCGTAVIVKRRVKYPSLRFLNAATGAIELVPIRKITKVSYGGARHS
jgi:hypothetical protein